MIDTAAHGLEGLNAVVTGAAQGLGLAIAEELGRRGARVTMADVQEEKVREAAAGLGAKGLQVEAATLDITDSRAVREFFEAFVGSRGRIDILVNNAGSRQSVGEVAELGDREWGPGAGGDPDGDLLLLPLGRGRHAAAGVGRHRQHRLGQRAEPGRPGGGLQCRQGGRDQPDPDAGPRVGLLRGAGQRGEPRAGLYRLQPAEIWRNGPKAWMSRRRR